MPGGLVLLASYPKSGNTWLRLILDGMLNGAVPGINSIKIPNAAVRHMIDDWLECETSELSAIQVARLRSAAYRRAAALAKGPYAMKAHDALLPFAEGCPPPFDETSVTAVLYLVRDPRDVAVSWSHHLGVSIDETIDRMNDDAWSVSASQDSLADQVDQLYSSWSRHVLSWVDAPKMKVHLIRYEDMKRDAPRVVAQAMEFAGLDDDPERLATVLKSTDFAVLQAQEQATGFKERGRQASAPFFRSGAEGGWRSRLTPAQAGRIEARHGEVMRRLGYLGEPG